MWYSILILLVNKYVPSIVVGTQEMVELYEMIHKGVIVKVNNSLVLSEKS